MFVVDTNVLVYAADASAPEHEVCRGSLQSWRVRATPWYLTWGIVYEFLRVITHTRVLRQPWEAAEAMAFVEALLASPPAKVLAATARHASIMKEIVAEVPHLSGNLWHDAHTAALMREHGIKQIITRDTHFHRFPWLEVVDPLG